MDKINIYILLNPHINTTDKTAKHSSTPTVNI